MLQERVGEHPQRPGFGGRATEIELLVLMSDRIQSGCYLVCERSFIRSKFAPGRDAPIEGSAGKDQDAINEIAEYVGKILIHVSDETVQGEISVRSFRSVRDQPPAPEIGG